MEIAISYWPTLDAIQNWKSDSQHQQAQKLGKEKWYQWYKVEVVEIGRSYQWQDKNVPKDIHAADN
jgi:heme-degrading monooxygenase HmoA